MCCVVWKNAEVKKAPSRHTLTHSTQASGSADTIVAADAPGSPDLYKCSQCKRKLANRKGAFDKKMQQKIRNKKRRQGSSHRCQQCETTDCRIVHDLVCAACSMKA